MTPPDREAIRPIKTPLKEENLMNSTHFRESRDTILLKIQDDLWVKMSTGLRTSAKNSTLNFLFRKLSGVGPIENTSGLRVLGFISKSDTLGSSLAKYLTLLSTKNLKIAFYTLGTQNCRIREHALR